MLPEDDMQYAVETCRSNKSVLKQMILNYYILVHLLVCDTKWILKMHGATIKIKKTYGNSSHKFRKIPGYCPIKNTVKIRFYIPLYQLNSEVRIVNVHL